MEILILLLLLYSLGKAGSFAVKNGRTGYSIFRLFK